MSQYSYYKKESAKYWTDPDTSLRTRYWIHDDYWQVDCELTVTGFSGSEGTDWVTVETGGDQVTGNFAREGVRDSMYFVDIELTATGFNGAEDTDWKTIEGGL